MGRNYDIVFTGSFVSALKSLMEKIKLQKALYEQEKQKALKRREKIRQLMEMKTNEDAPKNGQRTYRKGTLMTGSMGACRGI